MGKIERVRYNVMNVDSLAAFAKIKGGVHENCKDVYFVRLVGVNAALISDIKQMDESMAKCMADGQDVFYQRISKLPVICNPQDAACYESCFDAWSAQQGEKAKTRVMKGNEAYGLLLGKGLQKVLSVYVSGNASVSASMEKNFAVKLLFWHDALLCGMTNWQENLSVKLVFANLAKRQEYLFAYFLTLLGYDVLLLQSERDISEREEALGLSQKVKLGEFRQIEMPDFCREAFLDSRMQPVYGIKSAACPASGSKLQPEQQVSSGGHSVVVKLPPRPGSPTGQSLAAGSAQTSAVVKLPPRPGSSAKQTVHSGARAKGQADSGQNEISARPASVKLPPRPGVSAGQTSAAGSAQASAVVKLPPRTGSHGRDVSSGSGIAEEMSFEQLAQLAASVVMIAIHGPNGDVIGTGSGIMIGTDGYILTNNHVASGGRFYSVRIEDDETVYSTDELIKYHSTLDLAIIRIDRRLKPLPVYRGSRPLVRGQKVVAIGSPLGLFNSVSDGIISGFRKIDGVDMIQFTAPTSHGSSGGAVLNMYGEVIGMSTAGFDAGQNINLAMGYACISQFISGFV